MFRFASPIYLYLLILIPLLTAVYVLVQYRMKKQIKVFGDPELMRSLMPDVSPMRRHVKFALLMVALGLLAVVLARPQFGTRNEEVKRSGIEVAIAVDVSNSMLCQDVSPSRLDKSKMIVSKLIEQLAELGLDVSAKMFLDQLNPATISIQGTNVAEAITRATAGFSKKADVNVGRALILITDAEDNEDGAIEAAKEAHKEGIQIFVLSVGTEQGGPIPMSDGSFKKDLSGNVVTTKLNEQIGKNIAQAGGGMYIHVDQTNLAQSLLEKEIEKMQKEDISQSMYSEYDEQFVAVALLLFIVLVVEFCIMERKNHVLTKFKLFK